jgi:hypothetical protein
MPLPAESARAKRRMEGRARRAGVCEVKVSNMARRLFRLGRLFVCVVGSQSESESVDRYSAIDMVSQFALEFGLG